ncbi:hypothetical protein [Phycicoccus flavus]|uniref:hypothetical protein n=1 Tax=Phycicoccus flavus TaxID=2502783 RepID=UPI000FEBA228|nr:hypothetical protein [Phycicoccus flavus]NHA68024.1 hypothetical protein [Phycicoccus flavus]
MTRHPASPQGRPVTRPGERVRRAGAVGALALALATAGCGVPDTLAGLHPAPAEPAAAEPLDGDGAQAVTARVLDAARAVATDTGKKGNRARAEVMRGDALTYANALAKAGAASDGEGALGTASEPTVIAQSEGRDWPRAILATTLDDATSTQYLHVLVSRKPTEAFVLEASVPMFGGAALPAVATEGTGSPFVDPSARDGLAMSPDKALTGYASALRRPEPEKEPKGISAEDPFHDALTASADRQAKALKKLATLRQKHTADPKDAVAFRLADGGAVTFGLMTRTDTITVGKKAKELVLPTTYAKLVGSRKVTESMSLTSLEPVILVIPADSGDVTAIGATELLVSGKGS